MKSLLQNFFVIGNVTLFSVQLLGQSAIGECNDNNDGVFSMYCAEWPPANVPSPTIMMALVVVPMAFYFVMRDTRFEVILLSWLLSCIILVINIIKEFRPNHWRPAVMPVVLFGIGMFMIYYESHRQNLAMYLVTRQLQMTLIENEKLADETHANEMRAMIANVAHDLKTPLTSFLSGVEFTEHILEDIEDHDNDNNSLSDSITQMKDCLSSIHNTNQFMIMTINRCLDYTKASKGMKLVPKQETITLRETIELPLRVMRDMQKRREITLDESDIVNKKVCSHIITDKQWLQENLLCLLSNAVKYSTKGNVDIKITMVSEKEVMPKKLIKRKLKLKSAAKSVAGWWPSKDKTNSLNNNSELTPRSIGVTNLQSTDELDQEVEYEEEIDDSNAPIAPTHGMMKVGSSNASFYSIVQSKSLVIKAKKKYRNVDSNPSVASPSIRQLTSMWRNTSRNDSKFRSMVNRNGSSASIGFQTSAASLLSATESNPPNDIEKGLLASSQSSLLKGADEHTDRTMLKFEVQDTGIGLSDEAMQNLFNPFKQAQRLAGGTGLGLYSLAKRLEALGGYYGVERRKDGQQGSVFWFAFVYRPDKVSAALLNRSRAARKLSLVAENTSSDKSHASSTPTSPKGIALLKKVVSNSHDPNHQLVNSHHSQSENSSKNVTENLKDDGSEQKNGDIESSCESRTVGGLTVVQSHEFCSLSGSSSSRGGSNVLPAINENGLAQRPTARKSPVPAPKLSRMAKSVSRIIDTYQTPQHMDILLVDDSISILKMSSMMLKRQGHRIVQAENGAEALEIMIDRYKQCNKPFDVVVMDLQMPVMDGLESVRRLRSEEKVLELAQVKDFNSDSLKDAHDDAIVTMYTAANTIKHSFRANIASSSDNSFHQIVIGCSANSDHETMQEALIAGVDAFMAKPFTIDTFYEIFSNLHSK